MSTSNKNDCPKRSIKFHYWKVLLLLSIFPVLTYAFTTYDNKQPNATLYHDQDLCQQSHRAQAAEQLGLQYSYIDDDRFGYPTLQIFMTTVDESLMKETYALFYPDERLDNHSVYYDKESKDPICHLNNVKHHVKNINPKLLPYIPDDADHVSYSPFDDKAVYCQYSANGKNASACFYIHLFENRLIKDDISDMERANIALANQMYSLRKTPEEYGFKNPYVTNWVNKPPNLIYGIEFHTRVCHQLTEES